MSKPEKREKNSVNLNFVDQEDVTGLKADLI